MHSAAKDAVDRAVTAAQQASAVMQRTMPRATATTLTAVRKIVAEKQMSGVHGMLIELIDANERYRTAIETIAGMQVRSRRSPLSSPRFPLISHELDLYQAERTPPDLPT